MFLTYIKKYSLIFIVLASLMDSRINLESIKLQYALGLAACRSEIFGFGKSMSIPIDA